MQSIWCSLSCRYAPNFFILWTKGVAVAPLPKAITAAIYTYAGKQDIIDTLSTFIAALFARLSTCILSVLVKMLALQMALENSPYFSLSAILIVMLIMYEYLQSQKKGQNDKSELPNHRFVEWMETVILIVPSTVS